MSRKDFVIILRSFGLIGILSFSTGCGDKNDSGLVPVSGIVKYEGQPVDGAAITFVPAVRNGMTKAAACFTNHNGRFVMGTLEPNDGVVPGEYRIIISKNIDRTNYTKEEIDAGKGDLSKGLKMEYLLPRKYSNVQTSGLKIVVDNDGDEELEFNLTK